MKKLMKRKVARYLVILLAGFITAALVYATVNRQSSRDDERTTLACEDAEFANNFYTNKLYLSENVDKLAAFAADIVEYDGYKESPNCMYVLMYASMNKGDKENIQAVHESLKAAYEAQDGYGGALADYDPSHPDFFQQSVDLVSGKSGKSNTAVFEWSGEAPD